MIRSIDMDSTKTERQVLAYVKTEKFRSSKLGAFAYDSRAVPSYQVLVHFPRLATDHDTCIKHDAPSIAVDRGAPDNQLRPSEPLTNVIGNQWPLDLVRQQQGTELCKHSWKRNPWLEKQQIVLEDIAVRFEGRFRLAQCGQLPSIKRRKTPASTFWIGMRKSTVRSLVPISPA